MIPRVFIRDDDLGVLSPKFLAFHEAVQDIPVLYAVIPTQLTKETTDFIKKNDLRVAQHGFSHTDYGGKTEFRGRSYADQEKDVQEGWKLLLEQVPDQIENIFVPPYHGFDETTLSILRKQQMAISVPQKVNQLHLPVHISLEVFGDTVRSKTAREFLEEFICLLHLPIIGIYTHHDYVDFKELTKIVKILKVIGEKGKIAFLRDGYESSCI